MNFFYLTSVGVFLTFSLFSCEVSCTEEKKDDVYQTPSPQSRTLNPNFKWDRNKLEVSFIGEKISAIEHIVFVHGFVSEGKLKKSLQEEIEKLSVKRENFKKLCNDPQKEQAGSEPDNSTFFKEFRDLDDELDQQRDYIEGLLKGDDKQAKQWAKEFIFPSEVHELWQAELRGGKEQGATKKYIEHAISMELKGSLLLKAKALLLKDNGWNGYEYNFLHGIEILKDLSKSGDQEAFQLLLFHLPSGNAKEYLDFIKSCSNKKEQDIEDALKRYMNHLQYVEQYTFEVLSEFRLIEHEKGKLYVRIYCLEVLKDQFIHVKCEPDSSIVTISKADDAEQEAIKVQTRRWSCAGTKVSDGQNVSCPGISSIFKGEKQESGVTTMIGFRSEAIFEGLSLMVSYCFSYDPLVSKDLAWSQPIRVQRRPDKTLFSPLEIGNKQSSS